MPNSKKTALEPPTSTPEQVATQLRAFFHDPKLTAYREALAIAKSTPVAGLLDELALRDLISIELNLPRDSDNEGAQKTWECCKEARQAATSMKANYWLRQAMVYSKDFMLWDDAIKGDLFNGRKPGSLGPVAKKIKSFLKKYPNAKSNEVWMELKRSPPRGHDFMETTRLGRYIEKGAKTIMEWRRFQNLVSEHRPPKS